MRKTNFNQIKMDKLITKEILSAISPLSKENKLYNGNKYRVIKKVSVHLMITIQKVTSIVQNVPCKSPDIY
jgi:hypothetical protein